ncbi:MAG: branched-chain amino acid transport system II carrier protein [Candidatus Babeliaceae bacterium]
MKNSLLTRVYIISLTIFAMLFGSGNLMFPLRVGIESGTKTAWGIAGFIVTGVLLPLMGLLTIIAFKGDYRAFFGRLGKIPSFFLILFSMLIIGPFVVMPRIVTLSYEMLQPFLPPMHVAFFSALFLGLVFLVTYRPTKLLDIIGKFLSPLKVVSIIIIILCGLFTGKQAEIVTLSAWQLFKKGAHYGYFTLDLLGAIFFGSIIVTLLTRYAESEERTSMGQAVKIAGISGIVASCLLGAIYIGMSCLGAWFGQGLGQLNEGQIFSAVSFRVLGNYGAALIGFTVFLACFVTTVSLAVVVAEYVRTEIGRGKLSFASALLLVLITCGIFAQFGLSSILHYSIPFIVASYPVFIVITACNAAYALWGFKYIKIPTTIIAVIMLAKFCLSFFAQ